MSDQSRPPVTGYPAAGYPQQQQPGTIPNGHPTNYPTAGTAYPYAAPPPQGSYYNTNPYYADPYAAQRTTFVRRIVAVLIASIIITGTIVFIVWLVLRPQVPEFRVDSVTLSNFNISNNSLITGNWDVRFTVRNPNGKITLGYDDIEAYMFYKSETLAETTVPPFVQGTKNETNVRATFAASSTYLAQRYVDEINSNRAGGSVNFVVRMVARVRFKAGAWRARRRFLKVYCGDLQVGVSANSAGGSLLSGSRQCRAGV